MRHELQGVSKGYDKRWARHDRHDMLDDGKESHVVGWVGMITDGMDTNTTHLALGQGDQPV